MRVEGIVMEAKDRELAGVGMSNVPSVGRTAL
jgi:hypothetical protein